MSKYAFAAAAALSALIASSAAMAESINVSLIVTEGCSLVSKGNDVALGTLDTAGLTGAPTAKTDLTVKCTSGSLATLTLSSSNPDSANNFQVAAGSAKVPYTIKFGDASSTSFFTHGVALSTTTSMDGTATAIPLYFAVGKRPASGSVPTALGAIPPASTSYSDMVTIGVDFARIN